MLETQLIRLLSSCGDDRRGDFGRPASRHRPNAHFLPRLRTHRPLTASAMLLIVTPHSTSWPVSRQVLAPFSPTMFSSWAPSSSPPLLSGCSVCLTFRLSAGTAETAQLIRFLLRFSFLLSRRYNHAVLRSSQQACKFGADVVRDPQWVHDSCTFCGRFPALPVVF
jgi:hypothetical protein